MAWIELHQAVRDHRKTVALADVLDMQEPHVVGHLTFLWLWSIDNAPDGVLPSSKRVIERAAGWTGPAGAFVDGLVECGYLDAGDGGQRVIHDWNDYAGKLIERREANTQRMREKRAQNVQGTTAAHAPATVPYSTVPNPTEQNPTEDPLAGKKKRAPKPKAKVPESWIPDAKGRTFAIDRGVPEDEIDMEVQKFRDFHIGRGTLFADFAAAWRTWSGNYLTMRRSNITHLNRPGRLTTADHVAAAREAEERERRLALGGQS